MEEKEEELNRQPEKELTTLEEGVTEEPHGVIRFQSDQNQEIQGEKDELSVGKIPKTETEQETTTGNYYSKFHIAFITKILCFLLYNSFLITAIAKSWNKTQSYCHGVKFLVLLTGLIYFLHLYHRVLKPYVSKQIEGKSFSQLQNIKEIWDKTWVTWTFRGIICVVILVFVLYDTKEDYHRLISAGGVPVLILLGYIFSLHRSEIRWNQVYWGTILQFIFGLLTLRSKTGRDVFACFGEKINALLDYTAAGSGFVFGYLVTGDLSGNLPKQFGLFAFSVLPVILFFNFCLCILYYYGIMQNIISSFGWFLEKMLHTTACESVNAAGNIFVGMTEAPLIIKPYINLLTNSELHAVMTGGFATIAGGVMAAYISFGVSASHLLTASVMSAPAALAYSKLLYPETEVSRSRAKDIKIMKMSESNVIEAAANGASQTIHLIANICVNLIAFMAFIELLNSTLMWFGRMVGWDFFSFDWLLSKLFFPLCIIMGIEWKDCDEVAKLVGLKTTINEFVAYEHLYRAIKDKKLSERSIAISTYALCGFSNFSSIGIQLGGLGAMAPERMGDLARLGMRAMIAGCAACLMTACVAGTLLSSYIQPERNITIFALVDNETLL